MLIYIDLGKKLKEQFYDDSYYIIGENRSHENQKLFNTGFEQLNINITINFYEFVRLMEVVGRGDIRYELREILNEMYDFIKTLPSHPFKYSLEAFKLNYI